MARTEVDIGAYVNNAHLIIDVRWQAKRGLRHLAQQWNTVTVPSLHPREVPRRLRLPIKNVGDEFLATTRQPKRAVGSFLVADG